MELTSLDVARNPRDLDLVAFDAALVELARLNHHQSRVVELHYFGGLTFAQIAQALGISATPAKRAWISARLWLHWRLQGTGEA